MIARFDISKFGLYEDLLWARDIGATSDFKRFNIIFGRNYSGKSTLSRIFNSLERKGLHPDYSDGSFSIELSDGTKHESTDLLTKSFPLNVRVFNEDFVRENLNWLYRRDGTIVPFTVLGKENIEVENEIESLRQQLGNPNTPGSVIAELHNARISINDKRTELDQMRNSVDVSLRNKAKQIKEEAAIYNYPTYQINSIRNDLLTVIDENILSPEAKSNRLKHLNETELPKIPDLLPLGPMLGDLIFKVRYLVGKDVAQSVVAKELKDNPALQEWARNGIELHQGIRSHCGFCESVISEERWALLDGHFNKESQRLRDEIGGALKLIQLDRKVETHLSNLRREQFYSEYLEDFDKLADKFARHSESYSLGLDKLKSAIYLRESDIFSTFELAEVSDPSLDLIRVVSSLNDLIKKNNEKAGFLARSLQGARLELRLSEIAQFKNNIDYSTQLDRIQILTSAIPPLEEKVQELSDAQADLEKRITSLINQLKDSGRAAELVNDYLEKHFGHKHLRLIAIDETGNTKFKVQRDGKNANNLSTGECSLIAFCYFMARIRDVLKDDLVVFIDDPISSLDSGHIYFIFSLIKSEICADGRCSQLFISTHNLDFLKYLKKLHRDDNKLQFYLIERAYKLDQARCFLKPMPKYFRRNASEFNYVFGELYRLYVEADGDRKVETNETYNQFYNFPNNLRKFLEYYLFFRFPTEENLEKKIRLIFQPQESDFINRIINEGSHLTFIDKGWHPFDVPEAERCVQIVFDRIKQVDSQQFDALVSSIS